MHDCSLCHWAVYPPTIDAPCPVQCRMENVMEINQGLTTPIESPCPDFFKSQGPLVKFDVSGILAWDKILKIVTTILDTVLSHGKMVIEFAPTIHLTKEMRDMKNTFIIRGICPLGNRQWEIYTTNACLSAKGVEPAHLATIHEPLTDNPGWQFHMTFGENGIQEAITVLGRAKAIIEEFAKGYGSVAG